MSRRPDDFSARNAALGLSMGLLGWRERMHLILATWAKRSAAPGPPGPTHDATVHVWLGIIALLDQVDTHARSVPVVGEPDPRDEEGLLPTGPGWLR